MVDGRFYPDDFPTPAAIEGKTKLRGFGVHNVNCRSNRIRRSADTGQHLLKTCGQRLQHPLLAAQTFGGAPGRYKETFAVETIASQRVSGNKPARKCRCEREQILVGFKDQRLRHRHALPGDMGAHDEAACSKERAVHAENVRGMGIRQVDINLLGRGNGRGGTSGLHLVKSMSHHPHGRVGRHHVASGFELVGSPGVVAVEKGDQLAAAFRDAVVEGAGLSTVGFTEDTDLRGKLGENLRSAVRGAVIHNQNLALGGGKILCQHTLYGFFDVALVIVRVDQYAEKWCSHETRGALPVTDSSMPQRKGKLPPVDG